MKDGADNHFLKTHHLPCLQTPPELRSPRVKISLELVCPDTTFYSKAMISLGFCTNFLPFSPDAGIAMSFQLKEKTFD
jgi:hypothetical protein